MKNTEVLNKIVFIPQKFLEGNLSIYDLVKESCYFDLYNQISEKEIYTYLLQYPECVGQWITYSEDKRSSSGWFIKAKEMDLFLVDFFPKSINFNSFKSHDKFEACANFIKRELEDIRQRYDLQPTAKKVN